MELTRAGKLEKGEQCQFAGTSKPS